MASISTPDNYPNNYCNLLYVLIETLEGHFVTTVIAKQARANQPVQLKANDDKSRGDIPVESDSDNLANVVESSFQFYPESQDNYSAT